MLLQNENKNRTKYRYDTVRAESDMFAITNTGVFFITRLLT